MVISQVVHHRDIVKIDPAEPGGLGCIAIEAVN
jgi:hypothetical protein